MGDDRLIGRRSIPGTTATYEYRWGICHSSPYRHDRLRAGQAASGATAHARPLCLCLSTRLRRHNYPVNVIGDREEGTTKRRWHVGRRRGALAHSGTRGHGVGFDSSSGFILPSPPCHPPFPWACVFRTSPVLAEDSAVMRARLHPGVNLVRHVAFAGLGGLTSAPAPAGASNHP